MQLLLFAQFHLTADRADIARHRDAYNETVARQVDDFMRFINLHYVTERRDTPFWQTVADEFILPETRERLALWAGHMPRRDDFAPFPGNLPHIEEQLYLPGARRARAARPRCGAGRDGAQRRNCAPMPARPPKA